MVSPGKVRHPAAPSPGQHQPPSISNSSPAVETCTSAQKNELAGSQLLGCRGQPIRLWGHLTYHQGPGLGALDLKDWRVGPPQGLCPERDRREETGSREQATEVVGTQACRLRGSGHPPFPGCTRAHWGKALDPDPATRHFLDFFTYLAPLPVPRAPGE